MIVRRDHHTGRHFAKPRHAHLSPQQSRAAPAPLLLPEFANVSKRKPAALPSGGGLEFEAAAGSYHSRISLLAVRIQVDSRCAYSAASSHHPNLLVRHCCCQCWTSLMQRGGRTRSYKERHGRVVAPHKARALALRDSNMHQQRSRAAPGIVERLPGDIAPTHRACTTHPGAQKNEEFEPITSAPPQHTRGRGKIKERKINREQVGRARLITDRGDAPKKVGSEVAGERWETR